MFKSPRGQPLEDGPSPSGECRALGDVFRPEQPGPGEWGDPLERDPARVLRDVRNELVSLGAAHDDYGVVIDGRDVDCRSCPDGAAPHGAAGAAGLGGAGTRGESAVKYGVVFPQTEFGNDIQAIKDYAQTAEGLGYDYLLVYDHVLGAHPSREPKLTGPYTCEHPFHEPMVFFGFLAAISTRLELVTGIVILPQRQTVLVAKQTAEVDVLSGGRLRLGIGIGWNYVEYDALGESFQTRGRRVEEQIEVLRKVWTQPLVTHKTAHHVIDNAGINPLPIQRPIPVWFGGAAEPVLRRAARIGDGWMPAGRPPDDRMKVYVDQLHRYLEAAGRDPKQFGVDPWISIQGLDKDEWRRRVEACAPWGLRTSPWIQCAPASPHRRPTWPRSGPSARC
jgi:probable F420-dependent oxidoreductase